MTILEVAGVSKTFRDTSLVGTATGPPAVDDVSLSVRAGETLGIVGESGSGKSTLLRMVLRLVRPSAGRILYRDRDVWSVGGHDLLRLRRDMQAIFQDPASSFNPRQRIGAILSAPLEVHGVGDRRERARRVAEALEQVGLPGEFRERYPHQLSGGQRQRVAIARAVILKPSLVLADEPTSALDVSVQAQILNLFQETKARLGLTTIFVSHNLAVIRYLSDTVAVMRQGRIVEMGPSERVLSEPRHAYTQSLLAAVPDPRRRSLRAADKGEGMLEVNTFSISARCSRTGMLGVAVSTAVPGVGGLCPFVEAGVGAISTQSWVNPYLGIDGLKLLREGGTADEALQRLLSEDPGRDVRQVGIVDAKGRSVAWSGSGCTPWFGHLTGPDYAVQGNMLVGEETVRAMAEAFAGTSALGLPDRLMSVLEAGQRAGGDKRGRQSAALLVYKSEGYPYLSLRVDEHAHPVAELRRVFEVARQQLLPFVDGMPSRGNPLGGLPKDVTDMLMTPPPFRPGGGGSGQ